MRIRVGLAAAAIAFSLSGHAIAASKSSAIADAVADPYRPQADRDADARRKPAQTIAFSGVKEGDTVGEFLPGGGYYTRMLSDVVGPKGKVYALETTRWGQQNVDSTKAVLSEPGHGNVRFDASPFGQFNLPEKVDVFWTTLNYHDLHIAKYGVVDMAAFNKHVYDVLKPGGTYLITDHIAKPGTTDAQIADLHRIDKAVLIKEVTAAGFKLAGESRILANPSRRPQQDGLRQVDPGQDGPDGAEVQETLIAAAGQITNFVRGFSSIRGTIMTRALSILLILGAAVTAFYWFSYFTGGDVMVLHERWYTAFESSFPVADGWMAVCMAAAGVGLWSGKTRGRSRGAARGLGADLSRGDGHHLRFRKRDVCAGPHQRRDEVRGLHQCHDPHSRRVDDPRFMAAGMTPYNF